MDQITVAYTYEVALWAATDAEAEKALPETKAAEAIANKKAPEAPRT